MPPKIVVTIDAQGRLEADFVAFPGCSCETAERRLRDELACWGVIVKGEAILKTESQVLEELVQEERCRGKARRKISI